jgi:hypothetical protein
MGGSLEWAPRQRCSRQRVCGWRELVRLRNTLPACPSFGELNEWQKEYWADADGRCGRGEGGGLHETGRTCRRERAIVVLPLSSWCRPRMARGQVTVEQASRRAGSWSTFTGGRANQRAPLVTAQPRLPSLCTAPLPAPTPRCTTRTSQWPQKAAPPTTASSRRRWTPTPPPTARRSSP